ncbi:MAG: bifunctional riboflavin kinase/FAD synthetase [Candidatus Kapaibacterium sp.]
MKIYRHLDKSNYDKKSIVTVGTFDGVHRGHRVVIDKLQELKNKFGGRTVIVTFDPHPRLVLRNRANEIKLLSTTHERLEVFEQLGVDVVYVLKFTTEFSEHSAEDFLKMYLVEGIGLEHLVLGFDHSFGKNREGNYESLEKLTGKYNFDLYKVEELKGESRINSTTIRNLLSEGNLSKAKEILGADYTFEGKIVTGDRRGSTIGFPTANVHLSDEHKLLPKNGVYFVKVVLEQGEFYGMMNIGYRPTVSSGKDIYIEVNIFDFEKDIYGQKIKVVLKDYIRDEKKFNSLDDLVKQLNKDKEDCKKHLINNLIH